MAAGTAGHWSSAVKLNFLCLRTDLTPEERIYHKKTLSWARTHCRKRKSWACSWRTHRKKRDSRKRGKDNTHLASLNLALNNIRFLWKRHSWAGSWRTHYGGEDGAEPAPEGHIARIRHAEPEPEEHIARRAGAEPALWGRVAMMDKYFHHTVCLYWLTLWLGSTVSFLPSCPHKYKLCVSSTVLSLFSYRAGTCTRLCNCVIPGRDHLPKIQDY